MSKRKPEVTFPLSVISRAMKISNLCNRAFMGQVEAGTVSSSRVRALRELILTWTRGDKKMAIHISDFMGDTFRVSGPGLPKGMEDRCHIADSQSRLDWFLS